MIHLEAPVCMPGQVAWACEPIEEVFHGNFADTFVCSKPLPEPLFVVPWLGGGILTTATVAPRPRQIPAALERASLCARTARDHKARDIVVLDMRGIHPLYDYFVICTGSSRRQIHTLAEEIDDALVAVGDSRMGIEGYQASKWVVQDYGDIMVHVFDPDTREYYKLEELWADAPRVEWERD